MLAAVIGRPASCSQNRICRYSSSATVTPAVLMGLILDGQLIEGALARILVLAPAPQLGAVADAPGGDVVEVDFHDQLGAQGDPLEVLAGAPATGVGAAALSRLEGLEETDQAPLLRRIEAGAMPHDAQLRVGSGIGIQG